MDIADRAEILEQQQRDISLAAIKSLGAGSHECECGEPISDIRRIHFGATRCIDCQHEFESRSKYYAR